MASHSRHRKQPAPRTASRASRTATGATIAALATVTAVAQPAGADDQPTLPEVKDKVDRLYREAGAAGQRYLAAKEKTDKLQRRVNRLQDQVAEKTADMEGSRERIGKLAAAQYREGGVSEVMRLALSEDPEAYLTGRDLIHQVNERQRTVLDGYARQRAEVAADRADAGRTLGRLAAAQRKLATEKSTSERKLREARELLNKLTAEEKARIAAQERAEREAAEKRAAELARKERERREREAAEAESRERAAADRERERAEAEPADNGEPAAEPTEEADPPPADTGAEAGTKAEQAIASARAKIGLPYIWGGTGPDGYDCSGLTQAAWADAGVTLPRTTFDQVDFGTKVAKSALRPGDLVFFYDDVSHVGLYIGDGRMIHAPKPGDTVKVAPITEMPFHSAVRVT